jgi:glutaminyl-tRNA synthetase
VRLKHAYIITCVDVVKDAAGQVSEVHCLYDPLSKSGGENAGRKVRGTLHWVAAKEAAPLEVRLYDYLLLEADAAADAAADADKGADASAGAAKPEAAPPDTGAAFRLNPDSLTVCRECLGEPSLAAARPGDRFQFLRLGYFCADTQDTAFGHPVFNRVTGLRDTWAKLAREK